MKILYVLNSGNPGGMEKHVEDLVKGMVKYNHDVYVWCLEGEIVKWYEDAGAKVFTDNKISFEFDPKYIINLVRFLKEYNIDIAHSHEVKACSNLFLAGFLARTTVVSHTHTPLSEWQSPYFLEKIWWIVMSLGYAIGVNLFSTKEIALTQSRKKTKMLEGILSSKLEVIPNGLDIEPFTITKKEKSSFREEILKRHKLPKDAIIFGNVGRLTQEKGTEVLVRAFAELMRFPIPDKDNFYLLLVGGGVLEKSIKELAKELSILDRVIITGAFDEKDKIKYYSTLDAFIFPTYAEGFGIVLMEAVVSDLPVISSDLPVLHEVAEDTVDYFEVGNYDELAKKMEQLYRDLTEGVVNTDKAKELIQSKYSMDSFVEQYQNLYTKLLSEVNK